MNYCIGIAEGLGYFNTGSMHGVEQSGKKEVAEQMGLDSDEARPPQGEDTIDGWVAEIDKWVNKIDRGMGEGRAAHGADLVGGGAGPPPDPAPGPTW
jgi:hypothetical protein